jgi:TPR repeat protein
MARCVFAILIATTLAGTALADPIDDATAAYEHGDYATALLLLMPLADGGDRAAQHNLGAFFADGHGNYAEAGIWFRKAADQGLADAQFNLGLLYANGRGMPQDYRQSAKWYRNAAEQGHAAAQLNLGAMYANGQGVPRDYVEAHKWFTLAASNLPASQSEFREIAINDRDLAAQKMTPAQIAEAQNLAKTWKPK